MALQDKVKEAPLEIGFKIERQENGNVIISTKGAGLGWIGFTIISAFLVLFVAPIPVGFLLGVNEVTGVVPVVLSAIIGAALVYGVNNVTTVNDKFIISDDGFIVKGKLYRYENIQNVFIDNIAKKDTDIAVGGLAVMVGGSGVSGAVIASGVAASVMTANAMGAVTHTAVKGNTNRQFRIGIKYGSTKVLLARNLQLNVAESLFNYLTASGKSAA